MEFPRNKTGLSGYVYKYSVDYNTMDVGDVKKNHDAKNGLD